MMFEKQCKLGLDLLKGTSSATENPLKSSWMQWEMLPPKMIQDYQLTVAKQTGNHLMYPQGKNHQMWESDIKPMSLK
ncbi:Hypothetical predicted protein [Olea europaea subsp. europaea]|uniref:Uncharacterized protein n=1 Tax=Olea europaea subsp. europaea TaxID=158383 RepID=A0A8S0U9F3_OLEEU|nr:Hypothetical predicted protein [Olea europaea subsp. europaea]